MKWVDSKTVHGDKTDTSFSLDDLRIPEPSPGIIQEVRGSSGNHGRSNNKKALIIASVSAIAILALVAFIFLNSTGSVQVNVAPVALEGAERSVLLTAGGYVRSNRTVTLSSKMPGQVVSLRCDKGDRVKAGEILATIDSRELEAQLAQDEANYTDAKNHLERIQRLFSRGVVAKPDFDSADTRLKVAEGRLQITRTQLNQVVIRAPFSGIVLQKHIEQGELVFPGMKSNAPTASAIVTIADGKHMEVEADINETDIHSVSKGQPVEIALDAFPEQIYKGSVKEISPIADRHKNTIQVVVNIDRSDDKVRPDMGAKVSFLTSTAQNAKKRLHIPVDALRETAGKASVFVVQGERVQLRNVKAGQIFGTRREILDGLKPGEIVVTKSAKSLKDGDNIIISQTRQGGN